MRKVLNKFLITLATITLFAACKKEAVLTYLDVVPFPAKLTASTNSVSLSANNTDSFVITFSWPAVAFKIKAPVTYKLQLDVPADAIDSNAWSNAMTIEVGSDVLGKSFNGINLNTIALSNLSLVADSFNTVVARTVATLDRAVYSNTVSVKVKPYKVVVKNVLYVPGEYQGWDPATAPVIAEANGRAKMYEGYYYMPGSGIKYFKFTNAPDWNHINYGDGGNGSFSTDGNAAGLSIPDGSYYELTARSISWIAATNGWLTILKAWLKRLPNIKYLLIFKVHLSRQAWSTNIQT